jgi:transposase
VLALTSYPSKNMRPCARIEAKLTPFRGTIERLKEVPGLGATAAEVVLAEIGTDMSPFPTAGHLLSWAGFVPRLEESAGKRRSTRIKKGAPWLKPVLVQAAWGAARKKNSYFQAQFLRLKARHGAKKAAIAVGCIDPDNCLPHATGDLLPGPRP